MRDYSELELIAQAAVGFTDVSLAPDVVLELIAENKALRKDAGRYQWLRKRGFPIPEATMDAAMAKEQSYV